MMILPAKSASFFQVNVKPLCDKERNVWFVITGPEMNYSQIWCMPMKSSGGLIDFCHLDSIFEFDSGYHLSQVIETA